MLITYRYRLKSKNLRHLERMARSVNFVWNYCNETSYEYTSKRNQWLSGFDLNRLTTGCTKELGIPSDCIQSVCGQYAKSRTSSGKTKLSWRSGKRSLGWIPFKTFCFRLVGDEVIFYKHKFKIWKSRETTGKFQCGSFNQDNRGRWFVNIQCDVPVGYSNNSTEVGIDLGLDTLVTTSDGVSYTNGKHFKTLHSQLASAQRAGKKKRAKILHAKITNRRKDDLHKITTDLTLRYGTIFVGDVSPKKLLKTRFAKAVQDTSWNQLKIMLGYKAIRLGVVYKEIKENFSTVTCSGCLRRTGPRGLSALGVREWTCACGSHHDRDVNAAKNILRFGRESLIKGAA